MNTGAPLPKKLLVHRNNRRLIQSAVRTGDTFTVVYLDPMPGQPDSETGVAEADVIDVVNAWGLAVDGDWFLEQENNGAAPFRLWSKHRKVKKLADGVARYAGPGLASSSRGGFLEFRSWEAVVEWSAAKGIAPAGWTVDRSPSKAWVPVGDRRAANASPARPCQEAFAKCSRPVPLDDPTGLCGRHAAAKRKRDTNDELRHARLEQARVERRERDERVQAAKNWAVRLRDEFGVIVDPLSGDHAGDVALSPEGLYGLLAACAVELRELDIDFTELVPMELWRRPAAGKEGS